MFFPLKAKFRFLLLAVIAVALCVTPASAKDYMPDTLNVSLLRQDEKSGEAMMRVSTIVNMTGCPKVHPLRHEVEVEGIYLNVYVQGYTVDFYDLPQAPHFSCKQAVQYSAADIPLDRTLIKDNNIEQIRLVLDRGLGSDYYNVSLDEQSLELIPRSQKIFKPGKTPYGGIAALKYWYYPENTLILSAPNAQKDEQDSVVEAFALSRGLTPLTNVVPGFVMPPGQPGRHYYVDQKGILAEKISPDDSAALHDGIYVRRPGPYE